MRKASGVERRKEPNSAGHRRLNGRWSGRKFRNSTKSFQVGRAAQSGLIAARLADAGLTASLDALEHQSGFLAAFSPTGEYDNSTSVTLQDRQWHIVRQGLNVKRYPICYATHRAIDAALDVITKNDVGPSDVDRINVSTGEMQMRMLRNDRPKSAIEAKFSMEFAMACAVVARSVGLSQLSDGFVASEAVQHLIPRVSITTTTETLDGSAFAASEMVTIKTNAGNILPSQSVVHARGSAQLPLTRNELFAKFADCLGAEFDDTDKSAAFGRLMDLESLNSVPDLLTFV